MSNLKLIREPGYIYDLLFVFFLKFNTELCFENIINGDKQTEDEEYCKNILSEFQPISDDLFVFFHAIDNGRCFIPLSYFDAYKNVLITEYNISFLQDQLSDYSSIIKKIIMFYFHNLSMEDVEKFSYSNSELFAYIKDSSYSDTVKSKLYEFFINPNPYIQKLQYELNAVEVRLSNFYEKNYQKIIDVYSKISYEILLEQVRYLKDLSFIKDTNQQLYISFCLINKNCLNLIMINEGALYLLGYDYVDEIDFLHQTSKKLKLEDLGTIINEESRVKILNFILEHEEVSCKDLEKAFNFSGSTAYHHLTTMMKGHALNTRNKGKTILYSLNNKYFDAIIDVLKKYSSERRGDS